MVKLHVIYNANEIYELGSQGYSISVCRQKDSLREIYVIDRSYLIPESSVVLVSDEYGSELSLTKVGEISDLAMMLETQCTNTVYLT